MKGNIGSKHGGVKLRRKAIAVVLACLLFAPMSGVVAFGSPADEQVDQAFVSSVSDTQLGANTAQDADDQASETPVLNASDSAVISNVRAASSNPGESVDVEVDGVTYRVDFDLGARTACIRKITDVVAGKTEIVIPDHVSYDGQEYPVTDLRFTPFADKREGVTKLTLPSTLTSIGGSFRSFPDVTEMTIPGSVKNFAGQFQYMMKLRSITFEEGVEEISANSMVAHCSALATINLPSTLKVISGPGAFSDATALESIVLPEGVQVTEGSLFDGDTALTSVELPASVTVIKYGMFRECESLEKVTAKGVITAVEDNAFNGAFKLKEIPNLGEATTIGELAFYNCRNLSKVSDLKSVSQMGPSAFRYCMFLSKNLNLSSLEQIPNNAFASAALIKSVKFSENLISIGDSAFQSTQLSSVSFPRTLTSIGEKAFYNALQLSGTVTIPDSVTSIGSQAFAGAFARKTVSENKIVIGSGVHSINANVFPDKSRVSEIIFNNSEDDVTIAGSLPEGVKITYLVESVPDSVGDKISNAADAPTLQEAVNAAATKGGGDTIVLGKHIKLGAAVTVPKGNVVTIEAVDPITIAGIESAKLESLFKVEEGGSVVFGDNVTLSGRYNSKSVVSNNGTMRLADGAFVTRSTITDSDIGVIDNKGTGARFILDGGVIGNNALKDGCQLSGVVRAGNGASVEICSGSIRNNTALEASNLNSSSGLLLCGKSSGIMTGGAIEGNTGRRGSAVMLFGTSSTDRTQFILENGSIEGNTCVNDDTVFEASGAVHVEDNATFTMAGGSVSNNKGCKGAGVCVVDGSLHRGEATQYETGFVMNGGVVSGNRGTTGAGIYSFSSGVYINKGEIINNVASDHGGGIYSEGTREHRSMLHLANVLVTDNVAKEGGGMWYCATGEAHVHVTDGAAIFGNTAMGSESDKTAGDDFVFGCYPNEEEYTASLANRMLGGGVVQWYRDGAVYVPTHADVLPSVNPYVPRYADDDEKVLVDTVQDSAKDYALKAVVPIESAKKLAEEKATVIVTGNKALRGGGIGANGGIKIGTPGDIAVTVKKEWAGDEAAKRPTSVTVSLLNGDTAIDSVVLTANNGWSHTFTGLPSGGDYSVSEVPVDGYVPDVKGDATSSFVITNTLVSTPPPDNPDTPNNPDAPDNPDAPSDPGRSVDPDHVQGIALPATGDDGILLFAISSVVAIVMATCFVLRLALCRSRHVCHVRRVSHARHVVKKVR